MTAAEHPRSFQSKVFAGYVCIGGFAVAAVVAAEIWPKGQLAETYGPNLAAEAVGILVTLVFVEKLLGWQRARQLAPIRTVAIRRARLPVLGLVSFLARTYKAAAPVGAVVPGDRSSLTEAWTRESMMLDLSQLAPGDVSWSVFCGDIFVKVERELTDLIDRYAEALGVRFVVAAEELVGTTLFQAVKNDRSAKPGRRRLTLGIRDKNGTHVAPEFAARVADLFAAFDAITEEPLPYSDGEFDDGLKPYWGSSRYAPVTGEDVPFPSYVLAADLPNLGSGARPGPQLRIDPNSLGAGRP